ncbi:Ras- protein Rab-14 [Dimargaris verticillata]|uniref:Ras- protein Rab-14 n=1 Tax=Dimargaris verticillata TaxID=2761393 RepID=A0A9W8E7W8_9FUNG|nr:Ras- protein Rab-14 [Dimargaris verticillata]
MFRSVTQSYYRGTSGAILAYDITNRQSFSRLEAWLQDVRKLTHPQSTIMLVGTKCDGDDDGLRQVSYEEGHQFAHERELLFLETSAKSGIHVNACFEQLAHTIYCRAQEGTLDLNRVDSGVQRKGPYLYQQSTPVLGQRGTAYPRHSGQLEPADPPGDGAIWGSGRCSC